ncbi:MULTISPECIES: MFS transporter [unclassified Tatumella]|uniref:MFS transporter n=1 Tax=unclassified Tatumella TaxID=2649542 RepID=UPI001BB0C915|nr:MULTISPECIES: MFS transporter [unclassified Tatumella]MBS0856191.1 MFS transporter [Tatumella sp. JGM16]MBS0877545.1 MFS transporter [Tatumella sp. JGM82]MBS0891102.1 MFS transporter [Tatumella sp. JGM94]MBS0902077.1 MFS transporter [Tatumella sp. JGM100]MBS0913170.1 MFS transporter [Tatumella sp. JGM91]
MSYETEPEFTLASVRQNNQDRHLLARRAAVAAMTGTAIEYYEFGIYGFMASVIGPLFFPGASPAAALLSVLAVFGSAFLIRPLGGILLGRIGDKLGRRKILLLTVLGMGGSTAAIGLLPDAASAGILAPVLLVILRLAQGFFAGAEIVGAAAFVAESAPTGKRGFYGAFTPVGVALGGALAAFICGCMLQFVDAGQLHRWGWRIPFLLTIPLVILSAVMRHQVEETPAFKAFSRGKKPIPVPFFTMLREHRSALLRVIVLTFGQNAGYWIGVVFMNIYLTTWLGYNKQQVFWMMAVISLAMAAMMPFWGGLSDKLGRSKVLKTGFIGYVVLVLPMMSLMDHHNYWLACVAMFIASLPMPIVQSVGYPTYAEQFPTAVRYSGMALSINLGAILGGGLTPYLVTALIEKTGWLYMPGIVMACAALPGLWVLLRMRDTHRQELPK